MSVAQDDRMELFGFHLQHIHIMNESLFTQTRVKEQGFGRILTRDGHQGGKAVFGDKIFP